jgi:hypothetical protein
VVYVMSVDFSLPICIHYAKMGLDRRKNRKKEPEHAGENTMAVQSALR